MMSFLACCTALTAIYLSSGKFPLAAISSGMYLKMYLSVPIALRDAIPRTKLLHFDYDQDHVELHLISAQCRSLKSSKKGSAEKL